MVNWAEYRDMAKPMCPPPGTQIHNPFAAAVATSAPQLLTEIFGMFADSDLFSSSDSSIDSQEVQKNIDKTFANLKESKFECSTISDIELQLENLVQEKDKISTQTIPAIDKDLNFYNENIQILTKENSLLEASIVDLTNQIDLLENSPDEKGHLASLKKQLEEAVQKLRDNNQIILASNHGIELSNAEKELATEKIAEIDANINTLKSALADLNLYEAQLKKAEGRDAIEKLSNDDTENITKILKKLKTADDSKKSKYQSQLDDAIKDYYNNHKFGDNKTIDSLPQAKAYREKNKIA